ncbi:aldehyde dehydrogenase [Streptomyces vietnamensis]|uniref:Aldehyde dehydrogenase n=2 Tax=Streptomyces vietnamensis TaxID=362257 RepID=A0A0B5HNX7_9ACTN|nr:aldehyde dehydrogenase [Streptomyces vietnamensis]
MRTGMNTVNDHPPSLDTLVEELRRGEETWGSMSLSARRDLLAVLSEALQQHAQEWVDVACSIKRLSPTSQLAGEEWISGPYAVLSGVGALSATLAALEGGRSPLDGFHLSQAPDDRVAVRVLPHTLFDRLLLNGFTAEVWSKPGVTADRLRKAAGLGQRTPKETGGIGLVLGAGNIFSIAPLDTLYELFAHNRVVLLKLNPITDPLLPVLNKVFAPFIELGLLRIVTGGVEFGAAAVAHPGIGHVHITGSVTSHDVIVFGPGEEGRARQTRGEVLLDKPITSELGGVSPTIVVPGNWSKRDLAFQAEHIVTQKLHNNGYNCIASQVLVLSSDWAQKDDFLKALRKAFTDAVARPAYYPGSDDRCAAAVRDHPGTAKQVADGSRVLLEEIPVGDDIAFAEEYFAPVLAVTSLPGQGRDFLDRAAAFANDRLSGTLGANVVAHPRTIRALGADFTRFIADLRYGTVAVNAWTGVGYLTARATWGAFPGHTLQDAQSGIGIVHNGLLLDGTERTVVHGPFRPFPRSVLTGQFTLSPRPPWFVTNRTAAVTGRRLAAFAGRPGWAKLPGIFASALRG